MTDLGDPLDPPCPCTSGRPLRSCCALAKGPDESDADTEPVLKRLIAFGARDEFGAARRRLNRSLLADLAAPRAEMLGRHRKTEMQCAILVFLHMDLPCSRGESFGTLLLRREGASMTAVQRSVLANMVAHPTSLYEILDVFPGKGIELRDVLRQFTVRVRERKASRMVEPGWLLLTKVRRQPDGTPVMDMPLLPFSRRMRAPVDAWLAQQRGGDSGKAIAPRSVLQTLFLLWQREMAEALADPAPNIRLQNHRGEPLEECEAELKCDTGRLRTWLQQATDWMPDEDDDEAEVVDGVPSSWVWFERNAEGTRLTLAHLEISGDRVLLHVNSRARLERALQLLRDVAGAVLLDLDVQTAEQLLARARAARAAGHEPGEPEVPAAEQHRVVQQLMEVHYRKWVDEPLPVFAGRSPRQMAGIDPEAVSRAIWEICNGPPGVRYDARWMYDELGVRRFGRGRFRPGLGAD